MLFSPIVIGNERKPVTTTKENLNRVLNMYAQAEKLKENDKNQVINNAIQKKVATKNVLNSMSVLKNNFRTSPVVQRDKKLWALASIAVGGVLYFYYKNIPKLYANQQPNSYENELEKYQEQLNGLQGAANDYEKGSIVSFSNDPDGFNKVLHGGNVLYTYDESSDLKISANKSDTKHPIVAGNKKVKAAGHAAVIYSEKQKNYEDYQAAITHVDNHGPTYQNIIPSVQEILGNSFKDVDVDLKIRDANATQDERKILVSYKTAKGTFEYYTSEVVRLAKEDKEKLEPKKSNLVSINNESGHYRPEANSDREARKGWSNAGYTNLKWESHGQA